MFYTIVTNSENKTSYLVSSHIDFLLIFKEINSYFIENSYLNIIISKRNSRFETMLAVLKKMDINYIDFVNSSSFKEEKWIFLWLKIVNVIKPEANASVVEYSPLTI